VTSEGCSIAAPRPVQDLNDAGSVAFSQERKRLEAVLARPFSGVVTQQSEGEQYENGYRTSRGDCGRDDTDGNRTRGLRGPVPN
jgi:hypothetical protein